MKTAFNHIFLFSKRIFALLTPKTKKKNETNHEIETNLFRLSE